MPPSHALQDATGAATYIGRPPANPDDSVPFAEADLFEPTLPAAVIPPGLWDEEQALAPPEVGPGIEELPPGPDAELARFEQEAREEASRRRSALRPQLQQPGFDPSASDSSPGGSLTMLGNEGLAPLAVPDGGC